LLRQNGNNNRFSSATLVRSLVGAAGGGIAAVSTNDWQAAQGVINGASSVINVNGVETTGSTTGNTTAGLIQILSGVATTCDQVSIAFWDNVASSAVQRGMMNNNQRAWWMF
jgi:hypothetical protein